MRQCRFWLARSFHDQLKLFKVRGVHPDFLFAIDPDKARHNSDEMVRLEGLMAKRGSRLTTQDELTGQHNISFWVAPNEKSKPFVTKREEEESIVVEDNRSGKDASGGKCRMISCELTPLAQDSIVKKQLHLMFREVGLDDDFEVQKKVVGGAADDLKSAVNEASENWAKHVQQSGDLYTRGTTVIDKMARMGVMIIFETDVLFQHLVTTPEDFLLPPHLMSKMNPNQAEQMSSEYQTFLDERGLLSFDLRMFGQHSNIERVVSALERLHYLYDCNRGTALRTGVCHIVTIAPEAQLGITEDGCFRLPLVQEHRWQEFLLGTEQRIWRDVCQAHTEWRVGNSPKLQEQRRKLKRVADVLGFFSVKFDTYPGRMCDAWHRDVINRLIKDEVAIRKTKKKHSIESLVCQRFGRVTFFEKLPSYTDPNKLLDFRITSDGKLQFAAKITTPQILRVLKDNIKKLEANIKRYDKLQAELEFLSRSMPIDFSADTEWKRAENDKALDHMEHFTKTIKSNRANIARYLSGGRQRQSAQTGSQIAPRMHWVVSNRYEVTAAGVMYVPWDVDVKSLEQMLIARSH